MDVLESENQPGVLGIAGDVWHHKYENKKEGIKNYL